MTDISKHMAAINNLIEAIQDLQARGVGLEIEQTEDGRFEVGVNLDIPDISVSASYPAANAANAALDANASNAALDANASNAANAANGAAQ